MQSQCSCPKWYDVLNLDAVFALVFINPALCAKTTIESRRTLTLSMNSMLRNYLATCRTPKP